MHLTKQQIKTSGVSRALNVVIIPFKKLNPSVCSQVRICNSMSVRVHNISLILRSTTCK